MKKIAVALLKGFLALAGVFACLFAFGLFMLFMSVRAKELPVREAQNYIRVEISDTVLHAYTGVRWLDSQRYFVIQAEPANFDARIKKMTETISSDQEVRVTEGPGKTLWNRSESVPKWWDVDDLPSAVAVDIGSKRHNHSGSLTIFSKERGLIYIVHR